MRRVGRAGRIVWCSMRVLLCAAACSVHSAAIGDADERMGTSFFERFDHLNTKAWYISDGWSNGSHQGCTWSKSKVRIEGGHLVLTLGRIPSGEPVYQCGEVQSLAFYNYGTFEVRMRAARGSGVNSAFFTYVGPTHGRPHDEIDFEVLGRNTREVQVNTYVAGKGEHGQIIPNGTDSADNFVDYAFEWTPEKVRWFVNGKLARELSGQGENVPTHPSQIILSIWNGHGLDAWLGRFEDPREPLNMFVEHVAYTAPGDRCQFPSSIVCALSPSGK
jgi:endo-1,3-1,4-beta-glycanase ExoK